MPLKIALVAPSGVPFAVGGAEKLWWGLTNYTNRHTEHVMELIKLPSPEFEFSTLCTSYERWSQLDLSHFDAVISTKYPAWMVHHPNHIVYLQHKLRGLYDMYPKGLPLQPAHLPAVAQSLWHVLRYPKHARSQLPEIFGRARELLNTTALAPHEIAQLTALPGPLSRALVHKLDAIGLEPGAIRRYLTISSVVAQRADHFPEGVQVEVLPHPSNLENLHGGPFEAVFTASRLEGHKRIDLLINAYRRSRTRIPLRIAGDGGQAAQLHALAEGDERIQFLGRLTDEELVEEYSRAALVPFVPHEEDMGLITLEAMACGKPVLTTHDSGGVCEFVQDGLNGRCVAPTVKALASALDDLLDNPQRLQAMGQAAQQSVATVTWEHTVGKLLQAAQQGMLEKPLATTTTTVVQPPVIPPIHGRLRLLVVNTFSIFPLNSGGKKRMFHLYRGIAQWAHVTILCLNEEEVGERIITPHLREISIAPSKGFERANKVISRRLGGKSVTDIVAMLHAGQMAALRSAFQTLARQCDVVVCAHVYLASLVQELWHGPVWYDAHNVESDMKSMVLNQPLLNAEDVEASLPLQAPSLQTPDFPMQCVRLVAAVEARLVRQAARVWAVSDQDRQRFASLFGRDAQSMELAPNGTHLPKEPYLDAAQRGALKNQLGLGSRPLALLVAGYHGPNLSAVDDVLRLAERCPHWSFAIAGSVCHYLNGRSLADNILSLGIIEEGALRTLLHAADVGLNPMRSGSGTNLKMLDYAGHGLLILSTPTGARGMKFVADTHYLERDVEDFASTLQELVPQCPSPLVEMRSAARVLAEENYAWEVIAARLEP